MTAMTHEVSAVS